MDLEEIKDILHAVQVKRKQLDDLIIKRDEIIATAALSSCGCYNGTGGSGKGYKSDKIGSAITQVVDIETRILELFDEYITAYSKVRELAYKCEPLASVILMRRYIIGQKWDDIARALELSNRYVLRLHKQSLQKLISVLKTY